MKHLTIFALSLALVSCKNKEPERAKIPLAETKTSVETTFPITPNPNIYDITYLSLDEEQKDYDVFVSLSDILENHDFIPQESIDKLKSNSYRSHSIDLSTDARAKLLKQSKLSESDSLFIYNYGNQKLIKKPLKNLKAIAYLSPYSSGNEDLTNDDYMIGFQIEEKKDFDYVTHNYNETYVYFGKQNPFVTNDLRPIKWQKTTAAEFPLPNENIENHLKKGDVYKAQYLDNWVYIQELLSEGQVQDRLLVYTDKNKKVIYQTTIEQGEGDEPNPLNGFGADQNIQWIGKLFKDKPPVVFGFMSISFGCNSIRFLQKDYPILPLNCDNRH